MLEPVAGEATLVHIRNVKSVLNLHTQNGIPELGTVTPGSTADSWQVEPVAGQLFVRIKSVTTGLYLALQEATGPLSLVPLNLEAAPGSPPPPATAEWEFIAAANVAPGVAVEAPPPAAPPVAFTAVAPFMPPAAISTARSCRGGKSSSVAHACAQATRSMLMGYVAWRGSPAGRRHYRRRVHLSRRAFGRSNRAARAFVRTPRQYRVWYYRCTEHRRYLGL